VPETVIVVPCYNEADRLDSRSLTSFAHEFPNVAIVFVNDGSSDQTLAVLRNLYATSPSSFRVHNLHQNLGKAEATRQGILKAFALDPKYVGWWDADLSAPLREIPLFLKVLDNMPKIQIVFGARVKLLGRSIKRPVLRHYLGRISATVISWMLQLPVYDTQCGAKLFRANQQMRSLFEEEFLSSWIFDVEIIARMIRAHRDHILGAPEQVIYELPLDEWHHKGESNIKASDYIKSLYQLLVIYHKYL
jgi:dolichyl-phosphate beta-glucosyltransferase